MRHTLREVRLTTKNDTPCLVGISDDNKEWIIYLQAVQPTNWAVDVALGLATLCAVACERDPDVVGSYVPRAVPADERRYLDR